MSVPLQVFVALLLVCTVLGTVDQELHERSTHEDDYSRDKFSEMVLDVIIGTVLVIFTPVFLWFAETQVVKYETIIRRCQLATRKVNSSEVVKKSYDSRPIYVQGKTHITKGPAVDSELGYSPSSAVVRLERTVEMFQWVESKSKDSNDGNETVSYEKCWLSSDIPSHSFRDSNHHHNPTRIPNIYSTIIDASQVQIGEYILNGTQVGMLANWQASPVLAVPPMLPRAHYTASPGTENGYLVFNGSLREPHIGTVRVSYRIVKSGGFVSTIGVQKGRTFRPFLESDAHRTTSSLSHPSSASTSAVRAFRKPISLGGAEEDLIGAWSESQDTSEANDLDQRQRQQDSLRQAKIGAFLTDLNAHPDMYSSNNNYTHSNYNQRKLHEDDRDHSTPSPPTKDVASPHLETAARSTPTCCESLECCACCFYCMCCQPGMSCLHQLADWSVGSGILLLEESDVSIPDMFRHEWSRFTVRTWVIRLFCYLLLGCGLYMMFFGPVVYVVSFIPYVGWFVGRVLFIAALLVGLLEGMLITTVASVLHRPILLTGYLVTIGGVLWLGAHSAGWILAGQVCCVLSVLPLGLYLYQWIEEWRFVALQNQLDKEDEADESTPLVNIL